MENTLENKAKFFAQHWGQKVVSYPEKLGGLRYVSPEHFNEQSFLKLKPLSAISDEDAREVFKLCGAQISTDIYFVDKKGDSFFSPIKFRQFYYISEQGSVNEHKVVIANFSDSKDGVSIYKGNDYWRCHTAVQDYLRSEGYLLPFNGLSCEEILNRGWAVLEQPETN